MRALRTCAACALAAVILLVGAMSGGAFALPAEESQRADALEAAYGQAGVVRVGDTLEVAGQPMRLAIFYTADPPERVVRFYAEAFRARGLLPVAAADQGLEHVAAFDPVVHLQRFVNAVPQPGGQTLVMLGAIDRRKPASVVHAPGAGSLPLPDEHRAYLGFRSSDGSLRAESAQFVSSLRPDALATFYRTTLGRAGYRETTETPGGSLLTFTMASSTLSIALQVLDDGAGAAVFLTRTEGRLL
jgi:hypothetical protein